jgi:hypothetical protein
MVVPYVGTQRRGCASGTQKVPRTRAFGCIDAWFIGNAVDPLAFRLRGALPHRR